MSGPAFQARPGCVELALEIGRPIIALGYTSPAGFMTPGRWDEQVMVPPFSRLDVVAIPVEQRPDDTAEALLARVQATLEGLPVRR